MQSVQTENVISLTGPFISGSTHTVLQLGQRPRTGTQHGFESDGGGGGVHTPGERTRKTSKAGGDPSARRGRGAVSLQDLIDAELIAPGKSRLSVNYKGVISTAGLGKTGNILYEGIKYHSASSFSIHCKRQQMPGKQGDDGWKSVFYEGRPLEHYRRLFYEAGEEPDARRASAEKSGPTRSAAQNDDVEEGGASFADGGGAAAGESKASEETAAADTDQWVQCDRCRSWRIVPDSAWALVEADDRDVWFCSDATWDLTKTSPFTPACS